MPELDVTATALQGGDKGAVLRAGTVANVTLADGATKAVGTTVSHLAAGNRGLPAGGTSGQALVKSSATDYAVAWGTVAGGGGGIANLVEDTSPQLGGDLDRNGFNISGLVIGTHVQAYSLVLQNTTASFTLSDETKLDSLPDSASLSATLGGKAPLSSPTFSGTPTAPTASFNTNSTQLATTAYADTIAALKANLASPTFTGTPLATTAAPGTNTTQVATTAFATAAIAALPGPIEYPIEAGAMIPRTTDGATTLTLESAANKVMDYVLVFHPTVDKFAQFTIYLPKGFNGGTVTARFKWRHPDTTVNFDVTWAIQAQAFTDDEALDQAFGTAVTVTDAGGTTGKTYTSPETAAITIARTPTGRKTAVFQVYRDTDGNGTPGNDDLAVDAYLREVIVTLTMSSLSDA